MRHGALSPIAIDIGSSAVKLLQLDHGGDRPLIRAAAWKPLTRGLSEQQRLDAAFDTLGTLTRTRGFSGRQVVTALQPGQFQIKSFRLPRMPPDELESALVYEAEERFAYGEEPGEFRFISAGDVRQGNEVREELIVFGARQALVRDVLARYEKLQLEPVAVDAAPCAMARSFGRFLRRGEDAASVNVFVDVGYAGSSVVIMRGAEVAFVKIFDLGGAKFDEAVAARLGMSAPQAAEVRTAAMQSNASTASADAPPASVQEQISDALRPVVEHLAKELQLCLRYYAVTFRGQRADSVTFVGGEAHEPALLAWSPPILDVPCMVGDPLRNMRIGIDGGLPGARTYRSAWGVAAGLALRGSKWVRPLSAGREVAAAAG